jgi:L-fuculose-phosphate aldolase
MLITPSAVPYEAMAPEQLIRMALDGTVVEGDGRPSSEWRLHADIYRGRPEVGAVLHAHPEFCATLACLRREIPAVHYMVAVAGGTSIRCAPYATFGTAELAAGVLEALEDRTACLMANHGLVALGASPGEALDRAVEVEALAAVYWRALQAGEPVILSDQEMAEVLDAFRDYRPG